LKSALGDKADEYNNDAMKRFAKLTVAKKLHAQPCLSRCAQHRSKEIRGAKPATRLENIKKVCYVAEIGESLPLPVSEDKGLKEVTGRKRTLLADLAVVDDLSRLHDCPDDGNVVQALAIVGRGLPVVTSASWSLARGDPERVPKESVIRHRPLAMETKCVFLYDAHFQARSWNLLDTLTELSKIPGSKWKVRSSAVGEAKESDKGHEIVKLTGVDVVRSWIQKSRRIHNVSGSRARTLTEHIL